MSEGLWRGLGRLLVLQDQASSAARRVTEQVFPPASRAAWLWRHLQKRSPDPVKDQGFRGQEGSVRGSEALRPETS